MGAHGTPPRPPRVHGVGARSVAGRVWVAWMACGGAAGVAASAALPWARSGRREVSGYDLVGVARTFDLVDGAGLRVGAALWLAVPLVAAAAVALVALGRPRAGAGAAVLACITGLLVGSWVVKVAQGSSTIGAPLTILSSLLGLTGACLSLASQPRRT